MLRKMRGDAPTAEPTTEAERFNTLVYCDGCERLVGHFNREGPPVPFQGETLLPPIEFRDMAGKVRRSFHFCAYCGANNGEAFTKAIIGELVALYDERDGLRAKVVELEGLAARQEKLQADLARLSDKAGLLESAAMGAKYREQAFIGIIESARELFDQIFGKRPGSPEEARALAEAVKRWKELAERELKHSPIAGMMRAAAALKGGRKERGDG